VRNAFVLGVKLIGVWRIASTAALIPSAVGLTVMSLRDFGTAAGILANSWIGIGFGLGIGLFLLFGAEWIADQADLPGETASPPSPGITFTGGIQLIGVYLTTVETPALFRALLRLPQDRVVRPWETRWIDGIPAGVGMALGLLLIFGASRIARWIPHARNDAATTGIVAEPGPPPDLT
jgi:hypothetical protein